MYTESVRQDFCFACCLHGLIAESSITTLLGDIPMQSIPAGGVYDKDDQVQQYLSDSGRAEAWIDELDNLDGNVGAVSQAITEVICRLCSSKDSMSLKSLCSNLAKKPASLDVMLLFNKPTTMLQPLCGLLDNWRYDDDQGEYQPVYEEFGSILLLVLAFVHRYSLTSVDLGIQAPDSFVLKLITVGHLSRATDTLTETETSHLDGWIRSLFDSEGGGLGDELMSSCPPQDFYLLIPTLFHHIVIAVSTNNLTEESLKGGLEFLNDTFLLPSLVPGVTWLSSYLWESRGDANAILLILSTLIVNPSSISANTEASQMLNSVLNIISKSLEHSLRWLQRAEPQRQDVEPLSTAIKANLGYSRRGSTEHTELESWTSTSGGGLTTAIRQTINLLLQWSLNPAVNVMPASYSHRQILVGLKLLGAKRLVAILLDAVKASTEAGNGSTGLDIAASLICAPDASSFEMSSDSNQSADEHLPLQRRLTLREALKAEAEDAVPRLAADTTTASDRLQAETVIRLFRRVEAALFISPVSGGLLGVDINGAMTVGGVGVGVNVDVDGNGLTDIHLVPGVGSVGLGGLGDVGVNEIVDERGELVLSGLMGEESMMDLGF